MKYSRQIGFWYSCYDYCYYYSGNRLSGIWKVYRAPNSKNLWGARRHILCNWKNFACKLIYGLVTGGQLCCHRPQWRCGYEPYGPSSPYLVPGSFASKLSKNISIMCSTSQSSRGRKKRKKKKVDPIKCWINIRGIHDSCHKSSWNDVFISSNMCHIMLPRIKYLVTSE